MSLLDVPSVSQARLDARTVIDVVQVSTAGTLALNKINQVDASSSSLTMNLPTGAPAGSVIVVEKADSSLNTVTVSGSIREVASSSLAVTLPKESVKFTAAASGSWSPEAGHKTLSSLKTVLVATGSLIFNVRDYGAKGDGATDDTTSIQACINAAQVTSGSSVYFPQGTYIVSNLTLDYSSVTAQALSGTPYGYQAPSIMGVGKRKSVIQQKSGSTGAILTIRGKTGTSAGPGHNNKITGMELSDLEMVGTSTGSHGVWMQSMVDCHVRNVMVRNCGGSGVYAARETFVSGVNDEYFYSCSWINLKCMVNARYGFECSGTNSISGNMFDCDFTANTMGGLYLAVSNFTMNGCYIGGNGTSSSSYSGLRSIRNASGSTSINNGFNLYSCRFEGNSTVGGYDLQIDAGFAPKIDSCTFYSTAGEHSVGIGLTASGTNSYVQYPQIAGGYFSGDGSTTTARAVVTGSDCRSLIIMNPRFDFTTYGTGGQNTPNGLITDNGANTSGIFSQNILFQPAGSVEIVRKVATTSAASAGGLRLFNKDNGSGAAQLVLRFGTGSDVVVATEGVGLASGSAASGSTRDTLLNGGNLRESFPRTSATTATALTGGTIYLCALPLFAGDVVTALNFVSSIALTRGSTAGTAHQWAALYSPTLGLLGQSTDEGDAAAFAFGFKAFTLASPVTATTDGVYYAAIMANAGSGGSPVAPTLRAASTGSNAISTGISTQKVLGATYAVGAPYAGTAPSTVTVTTPLSGPAYVVTT